MLTPPNAFKNTCLVILLSISVISQAQISIIPMPVEIKNGTGSFQITSSTIISTPARQTEVLKTAAYFTARIKTATGFDLKMTEDNKQAGIQLVLNQKADAKIGQEGYTLTSNSNGIILTANTPAGLFYAVQTLLQLLPKEIESNNAVSGVTWQVPSVTIVDYPRFQWRGIMLDVSRHFFSKDYVKKYIDQLARYKYNMLHWHLTDDNGWRIEIKSYPKLTSVGAWRVPRTGSFGSHDAPKPKEAATDGGYYTQEDIKEIVQYAKDRYLQVLPEIDVPGHSMAAIASYPELCCTKDTSIRVNPGSNFATWHGDGTFEMHIDNTLNPSDEKVYAFLDKVFTEVAMLFPFEYIHMGGDECFKGYWAKDTNCQALMKKLKIIKPDELQAYFNKRISAILASKKKKMIGWDEILEGGLADGAAVMSWRGTKGGIEAAHLKHPVVMSPAPIYYLDMMQGDAAVEPAVYSTARLKDVYKVDILPAEIDSTYVLGGQGNLWTEQIPTETQVEYMTYPRAFALSETFWSPKNKKEWNNFVTRVENHFERFDEAGVNYASSMYDPIVTVKKKDGKITIELTSEVENVDLYYTVDNTIPNQYVSKYKSTITFPDGADNFRVISYRNGKAIGRLISIKTEDLVKRIRK
jgi:hexosaminidase